MRWPSRANGRLAAAAALVLAACVPSGRPVRVVVPQGASFRAATDSLARAGIIKLPALFRLYAKVRGGDRHIKAGTYLLRQFLGDMPEVEAIEFLLKQMARSKNNREFFQQMAQGG